MVRKGPNGEIHSNHLAPTWSKRGQLIRTRIECVQVYHLKLKFDTNIVGKLRQTLVHKADFNGMRTIGHQIQYRNQRCEHILHRQGLREVPESTLPPYKSGHTQPVAGVGGVASPPLLAWAPANSSAGPSPSFPGAVVGQNLVVSQATTHDSNQLKEFRVAENSRFPNSGALQEEAVVLHEECPHRMVRQTHFCLWHSGFGSLQVFGNWKSEASAQVLENSTQAPDCY
nr:hypothetical protein Iba_chr13aCG11300 [Ipomoea batatas]GME11374.1 hypothetical protein Iba_scaffold11544CG0020 [Ipomoea batatas]